MIKDGFKNIKLFPHEWLIFGLALSIAIKFVFPSQCIFPIVILVLIIRMTCNCVLSDNFSCYNHVIYIRFVAIPLMVVLFMYKGIAFVFACKDINYIDKSLQLFDHHLVNTNLSLVLQVYSTPVFTDILSFCYLALFAYAILSLIRHMRTKYYHLLPIFAGGLFSVMMLGYICYVFMPALGPYLAMKHEFSIPLQGGWIKKINDLVQNYFSNHMDAFPSLHCAISLYLLLFDYRYHKKQFYIWIIPCVGISISTIYLRYHYFSDMLAGYGLALLGFWLAQHYYTNILVSPKSYNEKSV